MSQVRKIRRLDAMGWDGMSGDADDDEAAADVPVFIRFAFQRNCHCEHTWKTGEQMG